MKIYDNDPVVPYKATKINALTTKAEIDGVLARWGVKDVAWHYDPANNDVSVQFQIREVFADKEINPIIKIEPPRIWSNGNRKRREEINWAVSMRTMYWYIKTHLENAYLTQSFKTVEFLSYVQVPSLEGKQNLVNAVIGDLDRFKALPQKEENLKMVNER